MKIKILVVLATVFSILAATNAYAYTPSAKVGNCYNYTASDVDGSGWNKGPVPCSRTHTAETYKIGKWPSSTKPWTMDDKLSVVIAGNICQAENLIYGDFNYWAWYYPNDLQWKAGQRWIRCDFMVRLSEKPVQYASWKGAMTSSSSA